MQELIIENAKAYIRALFRLDAGGHDAAHSLRVYHNALLIAKSEGACDTLIVSLAALLHDADDHKLFNTQNNANARAFLAENGVEPQTVERICEAIRTVSFSRNKGRTPATIEGKIVQDADRLDAIGAIGIARTFSYGGQHGRALKDSVQHFHDKLLTLKDTMHTDTAKKLAQTRHAFMETFLRQLDEEIRA